MNKLKKYIRRIRRKVVHLPLLSEIIQWSKKAVFPGFNGIPIYFILRFLFEEIQKDNLNTRANSIAFSFLLSIFPAIIFIFTLIPHLPIAIDYTQTLINSINQLLPTSAANYLIGIITDISLIKRGGLLSFGFLLALFFSSRGMLTLMDGFDKAYPKTIKQRGYMQKQMRALALTVVLGLLLIMSVTFIILGDRILDAAKTLVGIESETIWAINIFRWVSAFLIIYSGISIIYLYAPSFNKRFPLFNPGSLLATVLSLTLSALFAYFVNNFGQYNELYGSIGALIVIMVWLQYNGLVLLLGFELNLSIAVNRDLMMAENEKESESNDDL